MEVQLTDYDVVSKNFNNFKSRDSELSYVKVFSLLEPLDGKMILDYGCGEGRVARMVSARGAKVTGIDPSKESIELARNLSKGEDYFCSEDADFLDGERFDACMMNFVACAIHDDSDLIKAFKSIKMVLKSDGKFIVLVSNPDAVGKDFLGFKILADEGIRSGDKMKILMKANPRFYVIDCYRTKEDYFKLLEKGGFKVEEVLEPLGEGDGWLDEKDVAPYLILKCGSLF